MSHGEMSDFVSFPLFEFTLVIKLKNFDFESHWNILIFFDKNSWSQIWIGPMEKCFELKKFLMILRSIEKL